MGNGSHSKCNERNQRWKNIDAIGCNTQVEMQGVRRDLVGADKQGWWRVLPNFRERTITSININTRETKRVRRSPNGG